MHRVSTDDPFLPIAEQRKVGLGGLEGRCKYVEKDGRSHWFEPCNELIDEVLWLSRNGGESGGGSDKGDQEHET